VIGADGLVNVSYCLKKMIARMIVVSSQKRFRGEGYGFTVHTPAYQKDSGFQ
jgi:hypothetical protein